MNIRHLCNFSKITASEEAYYFLCYVQGERRLNGDVWVTSLLRKRIRRPIGRIFRRWERSHKPPQKVQ